VRTCAATVVGLLSLLACHPAEKPRHESNGHVPTPAFYHWKSTYAPTAAEQQLIPETLYIRFFDVDWNAATRQPVPKGTVTFRAKPAARRVVPVVFITNQTLLNLHPTDVPELARRVVKKIQQIADSHQLTYPELQFDCDWTRRTRTRYFALLRAIGVQVRVPLSATIRLHQVKYVAQTGVPPVGRGMLMAYNIGDWKRPDTRNSILDLDDLRRYTAYLPGYPLPLDVALPLFRWAVIFRNGQVLALKTNLDAEQVRIGAVSRQPFISPQPTDSTRFVVSRDTSVWGVSLRRGDWLRTEACPLSKLQAAKGMLLAQLPDAPRRFTLYHLDSATLAPYAHAALKTLLVSPR
jgi:hypothetical protein